MESFSLERMVCMITTALYRVIDLEVTVIYIYIYIYIGKKL